MIRIMMRLLVSLLTFAAGMFVYDLSVAPVPLNSMTVFG
jgi:hypothetical protein